MIERNDGWMASEVGEEMMMIDVEHGNIVGLNTVGRRVWELLADGATEDALCAALTQEYEVGEEECRLAVAAFLDKMERQGAIKRG